MTGTSEFTQDSVPTMTPRDALTEWLRDGARRDDRRLEMVRATRIAPGVFITEIAWISAAGTLLVEVFHQLKTFDATWLSSEHGTVPLGWGLTLDFGISTVLGEYVDRMTEGM